MKRRGEKIAMLTAYDFPSARLLDEAGVPLLLVGDSLGMVVLGYDSTIPVTVEEMIHHGAAVVRGSKKAIVVVDMPFMSYQVSSEEALRNAGRTMQKTGAQAVKLEGGKAMVETIRRIVECGIPVMGHLGLTPQSVNQLGGYRVVGKRFAEAERLVEDALAIQEAGVFAMVLESVPAPLSGIISEKLKVPTIGIGAGVHCDGQVQVFHDILSLFEDFDPRHARKYDDLGQKIKAAAEHYVTDVLSGDFPSKEESFTMEEKTIRRLEERFNSDYS